MNMKKESEKNRFLKSLLAMLALTSLLCGCQASSSSSSASAAAVDTTSSATTQASGN
jgi:uncharacterized lipoprotein YajG